MKPLTRRDFVRTAALAAALTRAATAGRAADAPRQVSPASAGSGNARPTVRWLDGSPPRAPVGTTWGMPWPRGQHARETTFALRTADGTSVPVQSWPLATWPDGSLKWTAHALPPGASRADGFELAPGTPVAPDSALRTEDNADAIVINTGVIEARIAKRGRVLVPTITRGGKEILRDGRLVLLRQENAATGAEAQPFAGEIASVVLEQNGPVRAVVRIEGQHAPEPEAVRPAWLPFVVRLYLYAGSDAVRVLHTIIYNGDERKDFIRGLGVRFTTPLRGELYDRHVRFSGQDDGLFAEAVRGLTGLRRDPGREVKDAQLAGRAVPDPSTWSGRAQAAAERLQYIPAFGDWTLLQATCDGFEIRKRTREGYTWLTSARGQRAGGLGYVGTPDGGVAFGIRNFWQSHPAQLDIRGAAGDAAEVTAWLWAPDAGPMDLQPYHDGMGQDTYAEQYNGGLEITYEDYEPGFDRPEGVARTSELFLWALAATPAREELVALAETVRAPAVLSAAPEYLHACGVFGRLWSPVDRSTPGRAAIEDKLDWMFDYYRGQQEQHRWYGYWNYGDVMHTYDADRHTWRYDVGGFAWDNSELSTDIWLWLYFLKTGRADAFRFAEAMTRHTGEVDVHHIGRFAPLGSRHNVLHWGCSAKQLRISTAVNRRYYYYLTGDERVGDLMREQLEAGRTLQRIPPGRKLASADDPGDLDRAAPTSPDEIGLSVGTDWGSIAGAWLTEWERSGNSRFRDRLQTGMRTLGALPKGFFTANLVMNLETGAFSTPAPNEVGVSHLNAVFGLVEICAELIELIDEPGFKRAWLEYCEVYNADPEVQEARIGRSFNNATLKQGHSRLSAYAAWLQDKPELAQRAWEEFFGGRGVYGRGPAPEPHRVTGPEVLRPVEEVPWVSTNSTAQWGLAAIQCLALVSEALGA